MFDGRLFSFRLSGNKKSPVPGRTAAGNISATRTLDHPVLGTVSVVLSRKARRITLTVKPDCTVRLAVPHGIPVQRGLDFLELKTPWVLKTIEKYRSRRQVILPPYRTCGRELAIESNTVGKVSLKLTADRIIVKLPEGVTPESEPAQQAIRKGICEAMRESAKAELPPRLETLAKATGLKYRNVAIRNTVSKWGSCSTRNDISLSLHLMQLPGHLIDYVLLHELCHTVHKNHGPAFHEMLDTLTGGRHAALRRELKGYNTRW